MTPNGIIATLSGPYEGRKHDSGMLAESQLLTQLQRFSINPNGQPMCIYGDPAYPLTIQLQCPFRGQALTPNQFEVHLTSIRDNR